MKFKNNFINKIVWGMVFVFAGVTLTSMIFDNYQSKNNRRYYLQGLDFVNKKDYKNAYYNFSSSEKGNEYYCPSIYRAALAAENLYDKESASNMYRKVIVNCGGSLFDENAKYNLARIYFEQKNFKKAQVLFEEIAKSTRLEKYRLASNYFLGEILSEKQPKKAFGLYLQYLEKVPDGVYSKNALEGIGKLNFEMSSQEHQVVGVALLNNMMYKEAAGHLALVPFENSWYNLAICARKTGDYTKAKSYIIKGLEQYGKNISQEELYNAVDILVSYYPDKKTGYIDIAEMLVPKGLLGGDYALYQYINSIPQNQVMPYYHRIEDIYPDGRFASDALWNIIYSQYKKGNYSKVIEKAEQHAKRYPNTVAAPRVLFFAGKAAEKNGQYAKARDYYSRVISLYPDDYYAFRSRLLLKGRKTAWTFKGKYIIQSNNGKIEFPFEQLKLSSKDKASILPVVNVGDYNLIAEITEDNEVVRSWLNYKAGNKTSSIVQARDFILKQKIKPEFTDTVYKLAYPLYYTESINKYSKIYDLDPFIVISIIREESHFDTDAKSYVGAGGLMQVMPDTAQFIAAKYNLSYNPQNHNSIERNIELGCAYLDYALSELSKKYLFAVAGYNGGHNAVKRWHNTLSYKDFDEFVEEIPYSETKTYIRKVFKSYWNYLNIYDKID